MVNTLILLFICNCSRFVYWNLLLCVKLSWWVAVFSSVLGQWKNMFNISHQRFTCRCFRKTGSLQLGFVRQSRDIASFYTTSLLRKRDSSKISSDSRQWLRKHNALPIQLSSYCRAQFEFKSFLLLLPDIRKLYSRSNTILKMQTEYSALYIFSNLCRVSQKNFCFYTSR